VGNLSAAAAESRAATVEDEPHPLGRFYSSSINPDYIPKCYLYSLGALPNQMANKILKILPFIPFLKLTGNSATAVSLGLSSLAPIVATHK